MPPPPSDASVRVKPSMLDGLHWKLLGYGFLALTVFGPQLEAVRFVEPVGKVASLAIPK